MNGSTNTGEGMRKHVFSTRFMTLTCASAAILLAGFTFPATANQTRLLTAGENAKAQGSILWRDGDLARVRDRNSNGVVVVKIGIDSAIERTKYTFPFHRDSDMDVTALRPSLTIEAERVGNTDGQLDASKISFSPDEFAIEVAEEQQVLANKASTHRNAQATADQGRGQQANHNRSADQAQNSADQASGQ